MNPKAKEIIKVLVIIVIGVYFLFNGLVMAESFLAPLSLAILLAMVMVPLSNKLEKWNIKRGFSSLISVLILFLFFIGLFFIVAVEIHNVSQDWPKIKKEIQPKIEKAKSFIAEQTGISVKEQQKMIDNIKPGSSSESGPSSKDEQKVEDEKKDAKGSDGNVEQNDSPSEKKEETGSSNNTSGSKGNSTSEGYGISSGVAGTVGTSVLNFFTFIGTSMLTLIYIFFLLLYRTKIKKSILRFTSESNKNKTKTILTKAIQLSLNYLLGRLLLILFLAIIYVIGLSVSGVKHAILISLIAALLSLVPYIGNIIGFFLAMAMGAFSGGDLMIFVGISITFAIAQFIESYILEPYVVGHKVELNPLIIIIVVVLGGAVWGVMGMIISIPVFGILKIVFDHIPVLNPLGYALGEEDISSEDEENIFEKLYKKIKGN